MKFFNTALILWALAISTDALAQAENSDLVKGEELELAEQLHVEMLNDVLIGFSDRSNFYEAGHKCILLPNSSVKILGFSKVDPNKVLAYYKTATYPVSGECPNKSLIFLSKKYLYALKEEDCEMARQRAAEAAAREIKKVKADEPSTYERLQKDRMEAQKILQESTD